MMAFPGLKGKMDAEFLVLLKNESSSPSPFSLESLPAWTLHRRNGCSFNPSPLRQEEKDERDLLKPSRPSFVEVNGLDVSSKGQKELTLAPSEWALIKVPFQIPNEFSEITVIKKCSRMNCFWGTSPQSGVYISCRFDLEEIRKVLGDTHEDSLDYYVLYRKPMHLPIYVKDIKYNEICKALLREDEKGKEVEYLVTEDGGKIRSDQDLLAHSVSECSLLDIVFKE